MQSACLVPIKVTATILGTDRRIATDQSTSVHLQTLQLQEKLHVFRTSFSANKERNYYGNRFMLHIFQ